MYIKVALQMRTVRHRKTLLAIRQANVNVSRATFNISANVYMVRFFAYIP